MAMIDTRSNQLSLDLLNAYQSAALNNAEALLEEAKILYSRQRFARAYFLAVSSIEETGKAGLAFSARGRNLGDGGVQKRLREIFENHSRKISGAFLGWLHARPFNRETVEAAVDLIGHLERGREPSMYIDMKEDGSVSVPATVVRPTASQDCIAVATNCLHHMNHFVATTEPMIATSFDDKFMCIRFSKFSEIFRTKDFGLYLLAKIEKEQSQFNLIEALVTYHDVYFSRGITLSAKTANKGLNDDAGERDLPARVS